MSNGHARTGTITKGNRYDSGEPTDSDKMLANIDYMEINARFCAPTHAPIPIVLKKGLGARVWDVGGNEYIDFLSAFSAVNQGHSHPRIVEAMIHQCQSLALCTSALQNETYPQLCEKICKVAIRLC